MVDRAPPDPARFRASFARSAWPIRARLALGRVLTGAALGLVVGAAAAGLAWKTRHGAYRPWTAAAGVFGAAAGFAIARRRRWSDGAVALYLDAKLGSDEAIATAVELATIETERASDPNDDARAVVLTQASSALAGAKGKRIRVSLWRPWHALLPLAAGAIGYASWLPLPPAAALPPPPGVEKVQLADVAGLEKVIELERVHARDDAQRERLAKLAEQAKELRDRLRDGMEKREAQAEIAKLRDEITAERLNLGDGERRPGLESAIGKLQENPDLKDAAKALGDRDLVELDEQMEKLAATLEKQDRERAKKTLEEAAEAAKKGGAHDVAKALEEQRRLMDQRGKAGDALRELAKDLDQNLGDEGQNSLKNWQQSGRPEDARKLGEALGKALEKMTPEQRKQLADNLKKRAAQALADDEPQEPLSKEKMKELAKKLDTPEGQKQLEDSLKQLAESERSSEDADRQRSLDSAQQGANEAEGQLGGAPLPTPMAGPSPHGRSGADGKDGKDGKSEPGHSEGGGPGSHAGQTGAVAGKGVKARTTGPLSPGTPMPAIGLGRASGRPGDTARVRGTDALGTVGPGEVQGVERSDVPEEYREQVGRYFQPK